ncbi:hypothetical protein [Chondromyces crocatus]|uniref:Uncharacterized protein n=1 Tax=Chondromyces crocatus TaxID=52 RepID=A0A0K1EID4_CHOCO|nr:hypothetical protein [Chondromyces crocatus]AKT40615.1 uncharacterized protein CMC5_047710 [Chondromyces crocatus]
MRVKLYVSEPGLSASRPHETLTVKDRRALRRAARRLAQETGKVVSARSVQARALFVRLNYGPFTLAGALAGQAHAHGPYAVAPAQAATK